MSVDTSTIIYSGVAGPTPSNPIGQTPLVTTLPRHVATIPCEGWIDTHVHLLNTGVLARTMLRGVRFDLVDAKFHQDSNHRSAAQLDPAAKSAMRGAFMMAQPTLVEPLYRMPSPPCALSTYPRFTPETIYIVFFAYA